jgi:hypothetical protein
MALIAAASSRPDFRPGWRAYHRSDREESYHVSQFEKLELGQREAG